jgi:hypothetical protein
LSSDKNGGITPAKPTDKTKTGTAESLGTKQTDKQRIECAKKALFEDWDKKITATLVADLPL